MEKMKSYEIHVNGKTFKYQEVYHNGIGDNVVIGTRSLENELVNEDGTYKGEYMKRIDEQMYGYVEDKLFSELTYEEFEKYVNENLD